MARSRGVAEVVVFSSVHGRTRGLLAFGRALVLSDVGSFRELHDEHGEAMADAYAWLRTLEHRIQLHRLRRTHLVPDAPPDLRRLGREGRRQQHVGQGVEASRLAHLLA